MSFNKKNSKNKKDRKKGYVVYPIEIAYLILIIAVVFGAPHLFGMAKDRLFSNSANVRQVAKISLDVKDDKADAVPKNSVFMIDEKLLVQVDGYLNCYDINGNKLWKRTLKSADTEIIKWNDNYIIADKSTGRLALISANNEVVLEEKNIGKIEGISATKDRIFLKYAGKNEVGILGEDLKEIARVVEKNGEIIRISSSFDSSELICFNTAILDGELKTFVVIYNSQGKILGTLDLNTALLFDIFVDTNIVLLSDMSIMAYNKNARPIADTAYMGTIEAAGIRNKTMYAIKSGADNAGGEKSLTVYDEALKEVNSLELAENAKTLACGEKRILVASDKKLFIYDYKPTFLEEVNLTVEIKDLAWVSDDAFYIRGSNQLILYTSN